MYTSSLWSGIAGLFIGLLKANEVPPLRLPGSLDPLRGLLEHDGYTERGWPFAWWGIRFFEYNNIPAIILLDILVVAGSCLLFCSILTLLLRLIGESINPSLRNLVMIILFSLMPLWGPKIMEALARFSG
jgi:hypothetical protein